MKNTHFLLANPESNIKKLFPGTFIGEIDGLKTSSMKDFHEQIGLAMQFPDYSGKNLDALDEMLNDLEWIKQEKVIIYIKNSADWLSKEKSEEKILNVLDIFDATAEDWKWMDEEEETARKELRIIFSDSERIRTLLEEQEIPFGMVE
ncbi:barstar family protein [Dyadobacter psychrotolerans]|uniref:Barnase inhibitor n=1 Tax=Dyadobacter psychrotolerans TaxID=2541721 RepID=A0A4R5DIR0_9BACT|nr:barstar family protein [Dyadobacter psychrotolerans]TDE13829.1 barnase inhibitor [Dyadobacter psychrotolerans]